MATATLLPPAPLLPTPPRSEMLPILPTPPRSKMLPLLPTPSCRGLTIQSTIPGRADTVERWDAHKKYKKPCYSPASSSSDSSGSPGRADSVERWDSKKIKTPTSSSTSSSSRESSASPRRASLSSSSCETGDSKYKRPLSCASSPERWDTHKKPRSALQAADAECRRTGEQNGETTAMTIETAGARTPVFAGASFFASPEPSALPMPTFLLAR